jgi:hypothetical protein
MWRVLLFCDRGFVVLRQDRGAERVPSSPALADQPDTGMRGAH